MEGSTNSLEHRLQPVERTPILSEIQLTLAPPCHPEKSQA